MARMGDGSDDPVVHDKNVERAVRYADQRFREQNPDIEVSQEASQRAFQVRLQAAMDAKGWNQSELARQCEIVSGKKFGRDRVHTYLKPEEAHTPRADAVNIMARALGISKELLYPSRERLIVGADRRTPMAEFKDRGDGTAWLRINQAVDYDVALKVLALLKSQEGRNGDKISQHR